MAEQTAPDSEFDLFYEKESLRDTFGEEIGIYQGFNIEGDEDAWIVLHVNSIQPYVETMQGDDGPSRLSIEVRVVDRVLFGRDDLTTTDKVETQQSLDAEAMFYKKYYNPVRNALRKIGWVVQAASAVYDVDNNIHMGMRMSFIKDV